MTIRNYSTTPANNNSAPPNGWPEGQAASTVNDCARQMMAEIRETAEEQPYFDWGNTPTRIDNSNFSVTTDLTARYAVGCRVKLVGATTGYGRITASVFGAVTTVTVSMDSGNVPSSLTRVAVSPALGLAGSFTSLLLNGSAVGVGANPSASIGLSAVNGSASTFLRSDGAPALSQSISPTWSGNHTFAGQLIAASGTPEIRFDETDAASDNRVWSLFAASEKLRFGAYDNNASAGNDFMTVDRTGTTVDRVAFPTQASGGFSVGNLPSILNSARMVVGTTTNTSALQVENSGSASATLLLNNTDTSSDNFFIRFATESSGLGTERGSIKYNRAGGVVAYNTTSDARLKKNFAPAPSARDLINCIPVESYDWKDSGNHVVHGLVAQRLNDCAPYAVTQGDIWQIDPSKLVPALIKYVQEQDERIGKLEAQLQRMQ